MADETDPWKRQWFPYVEGMEHLGGEVADFLDIKKDVLDAPRSEDVVLSDLEDQLAAVPKESDEQSLAYLIDVIGSTANGVLDTMQGKGISEAQRVTETFKAFCKINPEALPTFTPVILFYSAAVNNAETVEEKEDWETLLDIADIAELLTTARILAFHTDLEALGEVLDRASARIMEMSLTDTVRSAFEQMIIEARP